jgi:transcription elongation GreA/GreB family factor
MSDERPNDSELRAQARSAERQMTRKEITAATNEARRQRRHEREYRSEVESALRAAQPSLPNNKSIQRSRPSVVPRVPITATISVTKNGSTSNNATYDT